MDAEEEEEEEEEEEKEKSSDSQQGVGRRGELGRAGWAAGGGGGDVCWRSASAGLADLPPLRRCAPSLPSLPVAPPVMGMDDWV